MTEFKYTKDGKKVAVLGQLNSQEFIVQEIFVTNGQEVPGGENFVAKGLLDQPAESWREKRLREVEASYEKRMANMEAEYKQASDRLAQMTDKAKARSSALFSFAKNARDSQLHALHAFMSGAITHFYKPGYKPEILTWEDDSVFQIDTWGCRRKVAGIRLISLYGRSDGNLEYRLSQYNDGSGNDQTIVPCRSYEEALEHAQADVDEQARKFVAGEARSFALEEWKKIEGLKIPVDAAEKRARQKEQVRHARIKQLRKQIADLEGEGQ